jgi:hypothetical protein
MISKLHRLAALLGGADSATEAHVHFHQGPQGQPAVCHDHACAAPRLTV